MGNCINSSNN